MECDKVRNEFLPIRFEPCCDSCHEDEAMGDFQDLWFKDPNGVDRHVCCAIGRGFEKLGAGDK